MNKTKKRNENKFVQKRVLELKSKTFANCQHFIFQVKPIAL